MAALLAHVLGWDKSVEAVTSAARRLGFKDGAIGPEERQAILEDLAMESGIVGVTARYALSRVGVSRSDIQPVSSIPPASPHPSSIAPDSSAALRLAATIGVHEVIGPLAAVMGQDKAEAAVLAGLKRLGLPRERLDREQATRLVDDLGRQEGHVGATARFVRARVLAKFNV